MPAPPNAVLVVEDEEEGADSPLLLLNGVLPLIPDAWPLLCWVLPPPPLPKPLLLPVEVDDATWCRVPGILIRGWSKNARGLSSKSRTC